ncbi:MAG: SRPBCC domain-containing protein [Bacteroidia bacterium]
MIPKLKVETGQLFAGSDKLSKGVLIKTYKEHTLRFSMSLPYTREEVWNHFLHPEHYKSWLYKAKLTAVIGGKLEMHYKTTGYIAKGTITRINPGQQIDHTWEDENVKGSVVTWKFKDDEEKCLLILEHAFPPSYNLAHLAAGWHLHLELLASSFTESDLQWSWENWEILCAGYEKDFKDEA